MKRAALSYDALARRRLLDPRDSALRRRAAEGRRREAIRPPVSVARPHDVAGSSLRHGLSLRRDLSRRAVSRRGGPARPGDRAAEEGRSRATPEKWDYYHDVGFIYYWTCTTTRAPQSGSSRGADAPGAPWWLKTYAAVMLTRGGDRQASRFMWQQIGRSTDATLAARDARSSTACSSMRSITSIELRRIVGRVRSAGQARVRHRGMQLIDGQGHAAAFRSIPRGRPMCWMPATGDMSGFAHRHICRRCRPSRRPRPSSEPAAKAADDGDLAHRDSRHGSSALSSAAF